MIQGGFGSSQHGKVRVHELAKELDRSSPEVLGWLKQHGEFVKSASSTVEPAVATRVRAAFGTVGSRSSSPRPGRGSRQRRASDRPKGISVDERFRDDPDAAAVARKLGVRHIPSPRRSDSPLRGTARLLAERFHQLSADEVQRAARKWGEAVMSEDDVREWLDAGMGAEDHVIVAALKLHGVRPDHLAMIVDGQRIGSMLRGGASADRVVGILRARGTL